MKKLGLIIFYIVIVISVNSQSISELREKVKEIKLNLPSEIALYYKILEIDSNDYESILGMGNAYYSRWKILGKTDQLYLDSALIQLNKACSHEKVDSRAFQSRGEFFFDFNKYNLAYPDLKKALELDSEVFGIRWKKAKINMKFERINEAIEDLTIAINQNSSFDWLYRMRANCYAQNLEFNKCKNDISTALKLNNKENDNHLILGDYYALIKDYKKALKQYTYIINRNPSYSLAYLKRGNVYYQSGNTVKAQLDWKIADQSGYVINEETKSLFFETNKVKLKK